jgi:hypothetical protein
VNTISGCDLYPLNGLLEQQKKACSNLARARAGMVLVPCSGRLGDYPAANRAGRGHIASGMRGA